MQNSEDFLNNLRSEIIHTQERRSSLVRQKLTFVTSLLGLGSISFGEKAGTSILLYIAPIIAFIFDLYILGEDFSVKRAGGFLGRKDSKASEEEKEWEKRARENRDPFSQLANPLLSILVLILSSIILFPAMKQTLIYRVWLITNIFMILGVQVYSRYLCKKVQRFAK
ncbi:MAG: hypothetical protein V2A64_01190 [Candidatus Omnitrophota bacterium]